MILDILRKLVGEPQLDADKMQTSDSVSSNPDLIDDCRVMLAYALAEGRDIGSELPKSIATLDQTLTNLKERTISGIPRRLLEECKGAEPSLCLDEAELLAIYAKLAKLIEPATIESLRASEGRGRGIRNPFDLPIVVQFAFYFAIICVIGFIWSSPKGTSTTNLQSGNEAGASTNEVSKEMK